jgi:hypothetical protein
VCRRSIDQAALVALPGALDVVRAAMAQHPYGDVVKQGQAVLDAVLVRIIPSLSSIVFVLDDLKFWATFNARMQSISSFRIICILCELKRLVTEL